MSTMEDIAFFEAQQEEEDEEEEEQQREGMECFSHTQRNSGTIWELFTVQTDVHFHSDPMEGQV